MLWVGVKIGSWKTKQKCKNDEKLKANKPKQRETKEKKDIGSQKGGGGVVLVQRKRTKIAIWSFLGASVLLANIIQNVRAQLPENRICNQFASGGRVLCGFKVFPALCLRHQTTSVESSKKHYHKINFPGQGIPGKWALSCTPRVFARAARPGLNYFDCDTKLCMPLELLGLSLGTKLLPT